MSALSTDIRFAASHARFGLPEVRYAIYPFGGATVKLVQQIGYVHAMDLILSGRLIDANAARELQLVNEVVETDRVLRAGAGAGQSRLPQATAVQAVKQQIQCPIAEHARSVGKRWNSSWVIACTCQR